MMMIPTNKEKLSNLFFLINSNSTYIINHQYFNKQITLMLFISLTYFVQFVQSLSLSLSLLELPLLDEDDEDEEDDDDDDEEEEDEDRPFLFLDFFRRLP